MKEPQDVSSEEIIRKCQEAISLGGTVFIKWTCPGCGDRCMADDANSFYRGGYRHDKCGVTYRGDMFGMLVIFRR